MDVAFNTLQELIYHKTQTNKHKFYCLKKNCFNIETVLTLS